ncbi:MAG: FAD-dependent oxidoreductase [Clostridiales bacterium]|nr:FAD-dependent oxidoreductase [Clostridiales bacterium]
MSKIYDVIIIGGGPAGLSSGIYAGRAKLKTLIIDKDELGGQVNKTYEISNYPGARNSNGPKLMKDMIDQASDFGVEFLRSEVKGFNFDNDVKVIKTSQGELQSRSVIIATGASPRKLGFKGEKEFTGRGVAYCSTCDGQFFEGLQVFVIGAGFAAAEEAMFLTKYARKVTVIAREPEFTCAKSIADKVLSHPKVEVKFNTEVVEVSGKEALTYAKFINNKTGETFEYNVEGNDKLFGVFVFVGYEPKSELFKDVLEIDKYGYIKTNDNMKTKIDGVFVAGDVRPKELRQIVTAVSDGAVAAVSAERYVISEKERLGIKEEEVQTKKEPVKEVKNSSLGDIHRYSNLLNDDLRLQLRGIFDKLDKNVTIATFIDENNEKSIELKNLVLDIEELGEKINTKVYKKGDNKDLENTYGIDKTPAIVILDDNNEYTGVKFYGVPGGHELNSFVLALYNVGSKGQPISDEVKNQIQNINKKVNLKVCIALSCHLCPDVVVAAQRMAILNKNIEAEMIDISLYKDVKDKYNIMSVPALIVNDEEIKFGHKKIEDILEIIN